jgi:hypothetical protein
VQPKIITTEKHETAHVPPPETSEEMEARLKMELEVCNKIRALYRGKEGCPTCKGKGTVGVTTVRGPDYRMHVQPMACYCGTYGDSDFALALERIVEMEQKLTEMIKSTNQVVYGRTFFGWFEVRWWAVAAFAKKVWNGIRSTVRYLIYGDLPVDDNPKGLAGGEQALGQEGGKQ